MSEEKEMVSKEEARRQVLSIINRMALLHYCFSKTLVEELGGKKGRELIRKAIDHYGEKVGKKVKEKTLAKRLETLPEYYQEDLPVFGWSVERVMVDGEPRARVHACHLASVWKELGAADLGRLYCYVDQAKYKAYNPELECVHVKNILDGGRYCELAVRKRKPRKTQA